MHGGIALEPLLRRDRAILLSGLAGISALGWVYILYLAWGVKSMDMGMEVAMPQMRAWGSVDFVLTFVMWAVMMVAVMIPSAAPMVLMFATVNRSRRKQKAHFVPTGLFLASYLVVWSGFSALATLAQWQLHAASTM